MEVLQSVQKKIFGHKIKNNMETELAMQRGIEIVH